jgi:hypothetical protein
MGGSQCVHDAAPHAGPTPANEPIIAGEKRLPIGELGHDEFVGYSTPRNLNDRTYTVVWLALSLDPIDRKHAST